MAFEAWLESVVIQHTSVQKKLYLRQQYLARVVDQPGVFVSTGVFQGFTESVRKTTY
jgi:hypothetical protein